MVKEFRDFIERGNVVELAVAFVMGVAFSTVVNTFTERIINPVIGLIFSADDLENLGTFADGAGSVGAFIGAVINFLIVALVLFFVVKAYNSARMGEEEEGEVAPEEPSEEVTLLRQIRDNLTRQ